MTNMCLVCGVKGGLLKEEKGGKVSTLVKYFCVQDFSSWVCMFSYYARQRGKITLPTDAYFQYTFKF